MSPSRGGLGKGLTVGQLFTNAVNVFIAKAGVIIGCPGVQGIFVYADGKIVGYNVVISGFALNMRMYSGGYLLAV